MVVAIIGLLASLLLPALCRAKQKAKQASEFNAGRQLMLAWQFYADEHNDEVLPGYTSLAEAFDDQGHPLGSPIRDRYPWRLAPYLANNFRSIYVNESRRFLEDAASRAHDEYVYRASLYPSLGYNSVFLGGDEQKFNPTLAAAVRRPLADHARVRKSAGPADCWRSSLPDRVRATGPMDLAPLREMNPVSLSCIRLT